MHVYLLPLIINHIVEGLSTFKEPLGKIVLVEIIDWEMHCIHIPSIVVLIHFWPVDTSVVDIDIGLDIQDSSDSSFKHGLSILFKLWVWTDMNTRITDFIECETAYKVCISFLDVTIYNVAFTCISCGVRTRFSKLSFVANWVLNVKES